MKAFMVDVKNQPGEMARVTEALAARGINILVSCLGIGDRFTLAIVPSDEEGASSALTDAGEVFRELPIFTVGSEDKPGEAATIARKLADAGVNIELYLPVDTSKEGFTVAIAADDIERAREALSDQIIEFSYR